MNVNQIKEHLLESKNLILQAMRKSKDIAEIRELSKALDQLDAAYAELSVK
ncbi:hypothetical protein [Glutamicibacter sp.]|jgi:hypothetical protein|uniref:hypothetical protein n=1 Tax=Glutamicibacter sp. TaxID=1931995 RepID=UPI002B46A7EB|nr:hypothetical protein [Glutamicibacter sp.]HJX79158.1 hypothetical protein [Glutamicibacter sp.]